MKIEWILLAAGKSRRFGKGNKLLFPIKGKPLYRHAFDRMQRLCAKRGERLLVVVSEKAVEEDIQKRAGKTVWNPCSEKGISSSIQCALCETGITDDCAYLFFVADQPLLSTKEIEGFVAGFLASGKELGCVAFGERRGNPGIFSGKYAKKLLQLEGDKGGSRILTEAGENVYIYACSSIYALWDVDTKADLQKFL